MIKLVIKETPKIKCKLNKEKVYPSLEDLTIYPTEYEQYHKSKEYGYNNVIVKAVELESKEVTPSNETQVITSSKTGLSKVTVKGDENLKAENIVQGANIFGVEGTAEGGFDTTQIRQTYNMFRDNITMTEAPYFNTENVTNMSNMFYMCSNLVTVPLYDTSNVTNMSNMFYYCVDLQEIPAFNTSNVTNMSAMFGSSFNIKKIPLLDCSSATNMSSILYSGSSTTKNYVTDIGGFKNLGKAYTSKTNNSSSYKLDLSYSTRLTHESLMNIINNLYDLNLTYKVAEGGTLYRQQLILGSTNLAKLTEEEIKIATDKGWNVT